MWGMALGQVGTPSTRAVSVFSPKLCSVIMVMAVYYSPSPFLWLVVSVFFFEMLTSTAYNNMGVVPPLN